MDPRMENVWTFMRYPKKCPVVLAPGRRLVMSDVGAAIHAGGLPSNLSKSEQQDIALDIFFSYSFSYAAWNIRAVTIPERDTRLQKMTRALDRMRQGFEPLRQKWKDPVSQQHAHAVEQAIRHYEVKANRAAAHPVKLADGSMPGRLVDRGRGDLHARGYALEMAIVTRSLFGKALYRVIGTVTNVAIKPLHQPISPQKVRKWVEATPVS
jgi:hypothetical protein